MPDVLRDLRMESQNRPLIAAIARSVHAGTPIFSASGSSIAELYETFSGIDVEIC